MARKQIEYTVTISKSGSPRPRWEQPHVAGMVAQIAKRMLDEKQTGEETVINLGEETVTQAG